MSNFFSSIFGGSNSDLNSDIDQSSAISGYSTGIGEGDTTAASKFYQSILGGDPTAEATTLAPEISSAQTRAGQQEKQNAEFQTRSGGTAASNASLESGVNKDILNLEGGLKSGAASGAASLGSSNLSTALSANQLNDTESQQRLQNWNNSILGKGISSAVSTAETAGLGAAFGGGAAAPTASSPDTDIGHLLQQIGGSGPALETTSADDSGSWIQ